MTSEIYYNEKLSNMGMSMSMTIFSLLNNNFHYNNKRIKKLALGPKSSTLLPL